MQDVLRRRRQAGFVGRRSELDLFDANFTAPLDRKYFLFNVYGEGGVGKSSLLEQWRGIAARHGALVAQVDEGVYGLPEAMASIADQLGTRFDDFRKLYRTYQKARQHLERDPQTKDRWSRLTRTAVKGGLSASKAIPGAAAVVDMINRDATAAAVDDVRRFLKEELRSSRQVAVMESPAKALTPGFVAALRDARVPVALFFDTFEQTGAFIESWLIDLISGGDHKLPAAVVLAVAGRDRLDPNRWSDCLPLVARVPLDPFSDAEARTAVRNAGITDERTTEVILTLSGRLPLLVETLAKTAPTDPTAVAGDADATAVDRFLKWERDESQRDATLLGAVPRLIDEDLLGVALDARPPAGTFDRLVRQPFVSRQAGRYRYHGVVRAPMLRLLRGWSPQRWRQAHERLAEYHRARRAELSSADPLTRQHEAEETYHRLCADEGHLTRALAGALRAAQDGVDAARQWAEMLADAGRDADSAPVAAQAGTLLGSVGDQAPDCADFLTALVRSGHLAGPDLSEAYRLRARVHFDADRNQEAVDDCTLALEYAPDNAAALALRGAAEWWLDRDDDAIRDLTAALTLRPDDAWALRYRGRAYYSRDEHDKALADLSRALELAPGDAVTVADRGEAYRLLGDHDHALTDFHRAIELDPDYAWAIGSRGQTYRVLRRYDEALADLTRAIELDPRQHWPFAERGETYRLLGDHDHALTDFHRAIEMQPDSPWRLAGRGSTYRAMERYEEALADLTRAIELDPEYAWALAERGDTYRMLGDHDRALADFDRAIELDPDYTWALASRGEAHLRSGHHSAALADFDRALELDPEYAWALGQRGATYLDMSRYDEAVADLTAAIAMEPSWSWLYRFRGLARTELGRYREAEADLDRAIEMDPDAPAYAARAALYRRLGRDADAAADERRAAEIEE